MALVLRPSRIHAAGVFTTTPIRKGTRIVEYAGPRISPEDADRLYDGAPRTYLYGLEDGKGRLLMGKAGSLFESLLRSEL